MGRGKCLNGEETLSVGIMGRGKCLSGEGNFEIAQLKQAKDI